MCVCVCVQEGTSDADSIKSAAASPVKMEEAEVGDGRRAGRQEDGEEEEGGTERGERRVSSSGTKAAAAAAKSDSIHDIPSDALLATNMTEFGKKLKPYLWVKYSSCSSSEITAIITSKWKALKAARLQQSGAVGGKCFNVITKCVVWEPWVLKCIM